MIKKSFFTFLLYASLVMVISESRQNGTSLSVNLYDSVDTLQSSPTSVSPTTNVDVTETPTEGHGSSNINPASSDADYSKDVTANAWSEPNRLSIGDDLRPTEAASALSHREQVWNFTVDISSVPQKQNPFQAITVNENVVPNISSSEDLKLLSFEKKPSSHMFYPTNQPVVNPDVRANEKKAMHVNVKGSNNITISIANTSLQSLNDRLEISEEDSETTGSPNRPGVALSASEGGESTSSATKSLPIWQRGLVSFRVYHLSMKYFRSCVMVPLFMAILASFLTVTVMRKKTFRYSGKEMVIAFNLCEGFKCLAFTSNRLWKTVLDETEISFSSSYSNFFVYIIMWLPDAIGRIGILLNCLITIDRFASLAFPIKRFNKRLITWPKTCVVVIAVSMLVYQTHGLILYFGYTEPLVDYSKPFLHYELVSEIAMAYPERFQMYVRLMNIGGIMFRYIPTALTIVFNTLTAIYLYQHSKKRRDLVGQAPQTGTKSGGGGGGRGSQALTNQTNRMLVVSSSLFAVLVSLKPINRSLRLTIPEYGEGKREYYLYMLINEVCTFLDNSIALVNIIVYSSLSSQFSQRLKNLFCQPRGKNREV